MKSNLINPNAVLDIGICIIWILLASIFRNLSFAAVFLILLAIPFLLKRVINHERINKLIRTTEVTLISIVVLAVFVNFVIYPNTKEFQILRKSLPAAKVAYSPEQNNGTLRLIEIDTNFKETIFRVSISGMLFSKFICSDNLEQQYRIRILDNPPAIYEPWTGVKIVCSTLWYNISYIRNGSLYMRNNEIVFDSIKSNKMLNYCRLHGNTLYTYKYLQ